MHLSNLTLVATEVFLAGAFFLVTPTGLLALVVVAFFGPLFAPVFAVARFLVVVVVSGVGKIRGLEFPMLSALAELKLGLRAEAKQATTVVVIRYLEYEPVVERVPSRGIMSCKQISICACIECCERLGAFGTRLRQD